MSYIYDSMRKLPIECTPEIDAIYTIDPNGSVREKFAHIEHDGESWIWIPHEMNNFKVPPITLQLRVLT